MTAARPTPSTASPGLVDAPTLKRWLHDGAEIALLDVREHGQYGESHLFYATPLPYSRLELDVPRLLPRRTTRTVVYDSGDTPLATSVAQRAAQRLLALGYTQVAVLDGGTRAWQQAGLTLFAGVNLPSKTFGELVEHQLHTPRISAQQLAAMQANAEPVVVLDGRPVSEFHKMNIPGATCCPNGELALRLPQLVADAQTPIVINCAGRTRSIMGAQTLINLGVPNPVYALENGTQGWFLADLPLEHGGTRRYPDIPDDAPSRHTWQPQAQALAERTGVPQTPPAQVQAWAQEMQHGQRSLFLCDVRTADEYRHASLPGAQHTPGGQLLQAFDQYVGVRGARLVLFDNDGVRAPVVASWLRQMGHDASVLQGGLSAGLQAGLAVPSTPSTPPTLGQISAAELAQRLQSPAAAPLLVVDLRPSMHYRAGHIPGALWSIRPLLSTHLAAHWQAANAPTVVWVCDEPDLAAWATLELPAHWQAHALTLQGSMAAWQAQSLPSEASPTQPNNAQCIDYLFFVHDRHDGNKEAARQYLAWETGLLAQLDAQERAGFVIAS